MKLAGASLAVHQLSLVALVLSLASLTTAYDHVDNRCSCKCPEAETLGPDINIDWPGRKIYINSTVSPTDCDCEHVVKPVLGLDKEQVDKFCPRCVCQHETRSVTTIKVVVIIILWVMSILVIYLGFLVCVDPLLGGRGLRPRARVANPYQQHQDDDSINDDSAHNIDNDTQMSQYSRGSLGPKSVVNRMRSDQEKWKRNVEIQRSSVYDRHTMLN
eukprot:TRINITY_DN12281_c0_g1_i1.p1 TRINITY_DN12281_c0_g1~~TRINITY_DN12281_c0_g1_i1.p1  ORF type:complete len:216 (-),score=72.70 TRINITY_DN12281_c0_g1_i1:159-806(-)